MNELAQLNEIYIRQKRELFELLGAETRNKYSIETPDGLNIGYAAEQQKGLFGFLARQFLGHWRTFEIHFFDTNRQLVFRAVHPFRWLFQRLEVFDAQGAPLGALQSRFAIVTKSFDMQLPDGSTFMEVRSPWFRFWTFVFRQHDQEVARVEKKWSGALSEMFTDRDCFKLTYTSSMLELDVRKLLLAAGVFIDLQYFERKAD